MATPIVLGLGALAAGVIGRQLLKNGLGRATNEFVKGGFKAKMDRQEAMAILGLKSALSCAFSRTNIDTNVGMAHN